MQSRAGVVSRTGSCTTLSLFTDDGTMRKTTKTDLAKKLEYNCDEIQVLVVSHDNHTAYIIDGIALLQALDESKFDAFNDLGLVVMQRIQSLLTSYLEVTSVTLVFDRYDCETSFKQLELDCRTDRDTTPTYVIFGRRRFPNYRKFTQTPHTNQHWQSSSVYTCQIRLHRSSRNTNGLCRQEVSPMASW